MGGEEALELAKNNTYDIILLDHMMPVMDGIETLHHLKNMPVNKSRDAVVIALTANAVSGVREMYLEEGFDDYMSKPISGKLLEEMLAKHLPDGKIVYTKIQNTIEDAEVVAADTTQNEDAQEDAEPLLDVALGIRYCADSEEMYQEILEMFCGMKDEKITVLEKYLAEENWSDYTVDIHSLKSNSLNVGGKRLSKLCLQLETAAKRIKAEDNIQENIEFIRRYHPMAMALFEQTVAKAEDHIKTGREAVE